MPRSDLHPWFFLNFGRHAAWLVLGGVMTIFLVMRVPLMYRQPGGQDEEWFAVPGYTVAQEGVPRIPFVPSRDRQCVFYRADDAVFALPPAYFYWQAPFFLVLPAGYGTARLASAAAGLIAIWLVYRLGRALYDDVAAGLCAAALYGLSRVFFFAATCARPDMLCATVSLAALWMTWRWQTSGRLRWIACAGILVGLAVLTHPLGAVVSLQTAVWVAIVGCGWKHRAQSLALLVGSALAAFALWTPLIAMYPETFQVQFFNNVLNRTGPGLASRLLFPWHLLAYQAKVLWVHAQPIQFVLMAAALLIATLLDVRRAETGPRTALALAWSGIYLLASTAGLHPSNGYWSYPGALVFLLVGRVVSWACHRWAEAGRAKIPLTLPAGLMLVALMIPGFGLRAWVAHVRHWSDPDYNVVAFTRQMLQQYPADTRLAVDQAFVFESYLAGRPTLLACEEPFYFRLSDFQYDYLIVGPYGRQVRIAETLPVELIRTHGNAGDLFACYAQVYRYAPD